LQEQQGIAMFTPKKHNKKAADIGENRSVNENNHGSKEFLLSLS
jgi:hypothetical protein